MVSIRQTQRLSLQSVILIVACLFLHSFVQAQERNETTYIGLGVGTLTFIGDVNNQNKGLHPSIGRLGYQLRFNTGITSYLDAGLEAMFGQLSANERGTNRNLNFLAEIRSGGLYVAYNFDHFLKEDRFISPILSIGISGFEYLSKADLQDASGRTYYYWNDGTIRDLPQSEFALGTAQELVRDYIYESDLREANLDGFGDYAQRGLAFPIGVGTRFDMGKYLNFDIHARYYLTSTDYIDNITNQSAGNRAGNASNDRFFYTGFALSYGLHKARPTLDSDVFSNEWLAKLNDRGDEDKDGVIDLLDNCPHTPLDVQVDERGCPLDGDKDGVSDYLDLEMDTAEGAFVNSAGETLDDDYFEERYKRFTTGNVAHRLEGTVESASIPKPIFTPRPGKKFMVQIGKTEEGVSEELATLLLSIPDVQTITRGDTVFYMIGDYDNLPDAVRRQLALANRGVKGNVVSAEEGVINSESTDARKIKRELESAGEKFDAEQSKDVIWRVQVGAFKFNLSSNIFSGVPDMVVIQGEDGLTRYFSGVYNKRTDAEVYRDILQNSGFNDAFIAGFRGGKKISIREAVGPMNAQTSEELWNRPSPDAFNEDMIMYKVLLAKSDGTISAKKLEQFRELGKIEQYSEAGSTYYLIGEFKSKEIARERLSEYQGAGLENASIVGTFNGKPVTLEEIEEMKKN
jgi:hypothetical protein